MHMFILFLRLRKQFVVYRNSLCIVPLCVLTNCIVVSY